MIRYFLKKASLWVSISTFSFFFSFEFCFSFFFFFYVRSMKGFIVVVFSHLVYFTSSGLDHSISSFFYKTCYFSHTTYYLIYTSYILRCYSLKLKNQSITFIT